MEIRDAAGAQLWSTELPLAGGDGEVDVPTDVPGLERGRTVRVTSLLDYSNEVGIAEIQVIGEADLGPTGRAATDVVLRGSGVVRGQVLRSDGTAVNGGSVWLREGSKQTYDSPGAGNAFQFAPVPPGTYSLTADHPEGSDSVVLEGVGLPAACEGGGETLVCPAVDVVIVYPAFGSLTGTVLTAAGGFTNATARLTAAGFSRSESVRSTTGWTYTFSDVPPGDYTLTVTDSRSQAQVTHAVTVRVGGPTTRDVELWPVGTLQVTATVAGTRLEGGVISWQSDSRSPSWVNVGPRTSLATAVTVTNVPGPSVRVRVAYPDTQGHSFGVAEVALTEEGEPVPVEVEVPGVGEVAGVLRSRDGTPLTGIEVSVLHATDTTELGSTTSDAVTGAFVVSNVPVGPVRLRSEVLQGYSGSWTWSRAEVDAVLTAHGTQAEQDALGAFGALDAPGGFDAWQLAATAGERVQVLLIGTAFGAHAALGDPLLEVYGPDGALGASNDNLSGSDLNSLVDFTAPESGVYALLARAADEGAGGYRLASYGGAESHVFRAYEGAAVTGTLHVGGDVEPGHAVRLVVDGSPVFTARTDSSGAFSIPAFTPGPATVEAIDAEDVVIARQPVDVTAGQVEAHLVAPARVPVTVHVTRLGAAVADVPVTLESDNIEALSEDARREGTTSAAGDVETVLPIGLIRATVARDGVTYTAEETATGPPVVLEIALAAPPATVFGSVTGGSDATPVPGATVELVGFGATTTDGVGAWRFDLVPGGAYTLRASLGGATAETAVVQEGSDVRTDLVLPLSIVRGRVLEPSGTGAAATVEACGYGIDWSRICVSTLSASGTGAYAFYELPPWRAYRVDMTATLLDGSSLSATGSFYHYTAPHQTYGVDLLLPETGSITGAVGGFVGPVTVHLLDSFGTTLRSQVAGGEGFLFTRVLPGNVRVFAEDEDGIPGEATVTVEAGVEASVDVWAVPTGTLQLSLVDELGAPLAGDVVLDAPETPDRTGASWSRVASLSSPATEVRVPAGLFWAVFDDGDSPGAADGVLDENELRPVTVERGAHVWLPRTLSGTEGSYVADPDWCADPCSAIVRTRSWTIPEPPGLVRLGNGDRSLEGLLGSGDGVRARREYFAPPSGRFGRMLFTLTNSGAEPVAVPLDSELVTGEWNTPELIEESQPDGQLANDAWAAYRMSDGSLRAWVVGSALPPTSAWLNEASEGPASWGWSHTLPLAPGETRSFLAFSVSRDDADEATLLDIARQLADLTEPGALAGLSFEERETIANFDVPPMGDIEGTVTDEGHSVTGARVGVLDAAEVLTAEATTDPAGAFTIPALSPGLYALVAVHPQDGRPGRLVVDVPVGLPTTAEVTIAPAGALGGVHVVGTIQGSGLPAVGAVVELWADGYSPFWSASAILDASGEATILAVPPGPVEVRWAAPWGGDPATVVVSAGVTETVAMTATQPPVVPPVDLTGTDGVPYTVDAFAQVSLDQDCVPFCGTLAYFEDELGELWDEYPEFAAGTALNGGREVALGPHTLAVEGLQVTRRVFVPPSGRFARILDRVHNPGPSDVSFYLELYADLESAGNDWTLATSSGDALFEADDQYAVFSADGTRVVALVTAGAAGSQRPDDAYAEASTIWGYAYTAWSALQVPAGGSVIVMQFVVVRESGEATAAEQQAAALADLTDPEALLGLSAAERALIVNFEVP